MHKLFRPLLLVLFGVHAQADLIAHWTLDDASGSTTLADSSGHGHNATEAGGGAGLTLGGTGIAGQAASFNGSGFYATANSPQLAPRNLTVSFWMKAESSTATWRTPVSNRNGEDGFIFYRGQNADSMTFWMKGPGGTGSWNAQDSRPSLISPSGITWSERTMIPPGRKSSISMVRTMLGAPRS